MSKNTLIGIGIVVVGILMGYLGWQWWGASSNVGAVLTSSGSGAASSAETQNLLNFIAELKTIQIDTSIFTDPAFMSLQDSSVQIALQPVGRKDPFAPLPGAATPAPTKKISAKH